MKKLTFDFVKKYIETNTSYKLVSKDYVGANHKLDVECHKHGIFKIRYGHIKRGNGCRSCGIDSQAKKITLTYEDVKNYIETNTPYKLVSTEYVKANNKLDVECHKHGIFKIRYSCIKSGVGCSKCYNDKLKNKYEDVKNYIETNTPYKLVSTEYVGTFNQLEILCKTHGVFKIKYDNIKQGNGCRRCSNESLADKRKYNYKDVKNYIETNTPYKLVSTEYVNNREKLDLECLDHGLIKITYGSITQGRGCKQCAFEQTESKGEKQCREIFQRLTGKEFINIRPDFMKNPETKHNLELDGYCKELNLAFEYDGKQHFESVNLFGGEKSLKKTIHLDSLKNELCINNNVKLIRIPYNVADIEKHIKQELEIA